MLRISKAESFKLVTGCAVWYESADSSCKIPVSPFLLSCRAGKSPGPQKTVGRLVQHARKQNGYVLPRPVAVARCQQAKSLELRAAMRLARLWQCQDKRAEAPALLGS